MKSEAKPQQIKKQVTAKHFTAIIDRKKYTVEADAKLKESLTKLIEGYNKKNSEAKLKSILKALTPKEEKAKTELMVQKKKVKHEKKEVKAELADAAKADEKLTTALAEIENLKKANEDKDKELATLREASKQAEVVKQQAPVSTPSPRRGEY